MENKTFSQIVYLTRYGVKESDLTDTEKVIISEINHIGEHFAIPVLSFNTTRQVMKDTLFITLGGDGTMLTAMRNAAIDYDDSTVLGINFGNLGFLTTFDGNQLVAGEVYNILFALVTGQQGYKLDRRTSLLGSFPANPEYDAPSRSVVAINEILITTPTRRSPLGYDILVDNNYVATHHGDGVIISSATGSTAYAMSAGGAIMCPSTKSIQIAPLATHTLTSRPVVVGDCSEIRIIPKFTSRVTEIDVLYDGIHTFTANSNRSNIFDVRIKNGKDVGIWRPQNWNFFNILREKMSWGK